jgi:transmembrane sensor
VAELLDDEILERYVRGLSTPAEREAVDRWIAADLVNARLLAGLRATWQSGDAQAPYDAGAAWTAFEATLGGESDRGVPPPQPIPTLLRRRENARALRVGAGREAGAGGLRSWPRGVGRSAWRRPATMAAPVLVILGIGVAIGIQQHSSGAAASGREYATAAGQRLSVTLVDGTRLTLAPASRVRVAAGYGHATEGRDVELEGEAYFAVVHDATHPFAVRAHGTVARDIGTAFDVRAYPEDPGARIAVTEGAVAVSAAGGCPVRTGATGASVSIAAREGGPCSADARAGDVATVEQSGVVVTHGANIGAFTVWMQGGLAFQNTPLREAARQISRTFALTVTIADSTLDAREVTGTFGDQTVDEILDAVTRVVGAQYQRVGQSVVIQKRGPAVRQPGSVPLMPITTAQATGVHE